MIRPIQNTYLLRFSVRACEQAQIWACPLYNLNTCTLTICNNLKDKLVYPISTFFFVYSKQKYTKVNCGETVLNIIIAFLTFWIKFTFSETATKIEKIFFVNLTVRSNRQIEGEDFVNFCDLLRKNELYIRIQNFCQFELSKLSTLIVLQSQYIKEGIIEPETDCSAKDLLFFA